MTTVLSSVKHSCLSNSSATESNVNQKFLTISLEYVLRMIEKLSPIRSVKWHDSTSGHNICSTNVNNRYPDIQLAHRLQWARTYNHVHVPVVFDVEQVLEIVSNRFHRIFITQHVSHLLANHDLQHGRRWYECKRTYVYSYGAITSY